jgi:serine/threonine protein kinase
MVGMVVGSGSVAGQDTESRAENEVVRRVGRGESAGAIASFLRPLRGTPTRITAEVSCPVAGEQFMSSAGDPTAVFFANLRASGLLRQSQLQELWAWAAAHQPDVPNLAKEITRRRWLTAFQIKEIFRGRGRELTIDRFVLEDLLGEGGMGRVYKAVDIRLGRTVALKLIRPERLQHAAAQARFNQEIQALSKMKHPNVVDVFDAGKVGDTHYCVMEYVDGVDLTRIVRESGPLPVQEACDYIRQAALGLHHAYEKGLVHRDIKPSNILVSRANRLVKLVDLGLARLMENEEAVGGAEAGRITQEGFVLGTPDFLAPEQARNPMAVDIRADIYALGGTLYYVLTGKTPFDGANPTEKLLRHCTDPPPSLLQRRPDAPPAVEQIIHWCMAKQPEARPQTPLELAVALQPFCPPPPPGYPTSMSGRHPIPAAPLSAAVQPLPVPPATPAPRLPPPPASDPVSSSMLFKLPPQLTTADPIRRRAKPSFPWSPVLLGLGSLLVIAILGYAAYLAFVSPGDPPLDSFTNSLGLKMVKLDGGTFRMGSAPTEPGHSPEEAPAHSVTLTGPFLISATEVTHGQYLKLMGSSPARLAPKAQRGQYRPVESITWQEANEFCQKLTEVEKDQKWSRRGWAYRLPTEAEWEFAARAGTETPFAFGNQLEFQKQGLFLPVENDLLGIGGNEVPILTQEVGQSKANGFGLHDLHGNVAEWCLDWYRPGYPGEGLRQNPTGPADGDKRVIRGGSFRTPAVGTRSAARAGVRPTERRDDIGFRIVYAPILK